MAEHKRPNSIPGYVHPTTMKYSRDGVYKTFTEGKKAKKKENFGKTTVGKAYASYGDYEEEKCPVCKEPPATTCPCGHSDKKCASGHSWYTDRAGKVTVGDPHC